MDRDLDVLRVLLGKKRGGRIENWSFVPVGLEKRVCMGRIYGQEDQLDGGQICTSIISVYNAKENYIVTSNTLYTLGKPDLFFEKIYE